MNPYENYYLEQAGGQVHTVYSGRRYQRGSGIGAIFGKLFRFALPLVKKGLKAVGREALRAGTRIFEDVDNNVPVRESFRNRFTESRTNLRRAATDKISTMMHGSGYKSLPRKRNGQFLSLPPGERIGEKKSKKKKKKKQIADNRAPVKIRKHAAKKSCSKKNGEIFRDIFR